MQWCSYLLLMAAESVTLVVVVVVCVCVYIYIYIYIYIYSFRPDRLAARDRCPPVNLLNVSAMYVIHSVRQRSSVLCILSPTGQFAKTKISSKKAHFPRNVFLKLRIFSVLHKTITKLFSRPASH